MLPRLRRALAEHKPDLTIFLAGTNDLSDGPTAAPHVASCLGEMWRASAEAGGKVLQLTVPETGLSGFMEAGVMLNGLIRREVDRRASDGIAIGLFDLCRTFPYVSLSEVERTRLWDADGIHPTPVGYDRIAELLVDPVKQMLVL